MQKIYSLFFLFFICSNFISGQESAVQLPQSTTTKTLLWEVSGGGLSKPSYFLGTMHVLCPEDAFLSESVHKILDRVSEIYFEIDLDNMALMLAAMGSMTMRNDTLLSDLMAESDYMELEAFFSGKFPLPFGVLKRMKPMLLAGMLSEQMLPCKAGSGTEMLLSEEAGKRKIPTKGLETPAFQFGIFDSIPYAYQAQELLKAVRQDGMQPSDSGNIAQLLAAYQAQDLGQIEKLTISEEAGLKGYLDLLIYNRNRNWVKQFERIAQHGSFLFAVGAGHLPGEDGVLQLLAKKGYSLKPLVNGKP